MAASALTIGEIISWISDVGSLALMVLAFVAGLRGYWVFGWVHRDIVSRLTEDNKALRAENRRYVELALNGTLLAKSAITLAETTENLPPSVLSDGNTSSQLKTGET